MASKDFPERIIAPDNRVPGVNVSKTGNRQFAAFGSIYLDNNEEVYTEKIAYVKIPNHEVNTVYLLSIALTMLSAVGGDFDENDTAFADIFSIGVDPDTDLDIKPDAAAGYGGVWGRHFGGGGFGLGIHQEGTMGISTYVGIIKGETVKFRVACQGDNWVGASYFVLELGTQN
jgi:hypothetical protein